MKIDKDLLEKYAPRKMNRAKNIRDDLGFREPKNVSPMEALTSAAQAPADMAAGALNLIPGLQQRFGDPTKPFRIPINENPNELYYALGGFATPFGAGIKAASAIPKVGGAVKAAHNYAKGIPDRMMASATRPGLGRTMGTEALRGAGRGAASSAAIGETLRPQGSEQYENLGFNSGLGALLGGAMGGAFSIIPGFANKTVSNAERAYKETPNLIRSPKEVANISRNVPEGVRVNLGEYTKEPNSRAYYTDTLGNAPGSKVKQNERGALNAATEKTNAFVNDLLGGLHPSEVNNKISGSVKERGLANKAKAGKYYKKTFKEGDKLGVKISETPELDAGIQGILKKHDKGWLQSFSEDSVKTLKKLGGQLSDQQEKLVRKEVEKYKNAPAIALEKELNKYKGIGQEAGKKIEAELRQDLQYKNPTPKSVKILEDKLRAKYAREPMTLEEAKNLRSDLLKAQRAAEEAKEDAKAYAMGQAAKLIDGEITKNIKATGSKSLERNWKKGNKIFREEYVPYGKDTTTRKVLKGEENIEPSKIIKEAKFKTKTDEGNDFGKIYSDLSAKDKNLVAFDLLKKAVEGKEGKSISTPLALSNRAKHISDDLKKKAFTPDQRKELDNLKALADITQSARKGARKKSTNLADQPISETFYGDMKKYGLSYLNSPIGKTTAKIMTSPAVRKAYETGKPLSYEELMKEFKVLSKGKYLRHGIERTAYTAGKDKQSEKK